MTSPIHSSKQDGLKDMFPENSRLLSNDRLISELDTISLISFKNARLAQRMLLSIRFPHGLYHLREAMFTHIWWALSIQTSPERELSMQDRFFESLPSIMPNASRVSVKIDRRHQPDGWIEIDGVLHCMEMKRSKFNGAALRQLIRYMKFYKAGNGIAVAPTLSVKLPENIRFIQFNDIKKETNDGETEQTELS